MNMSDLEKLLNGVQYKAPENFTAGVMEKVDSCPRNSGSRFASNPYYRTGLSQPDYPVPEPDAMDGLSDERCGEPDPFPRRDGRLFPRSQFHRIYYPEDRFDPEQAFSVFNRSIE